jgi:hypothetical protein
LIGCGKFDITAAFIGFALTLWWAERQTRGIKGNSPADMALVVPWGLISLGGQPTAMRLPYPIVSGSELCHVVESADYARSAKTPCAKSFSLLHLG